MTKILLIDAGSDKAVSEVQHVIDNVCKCEPHNVTVLVTPKSKSSYVQFSKNNPLVQIRFGGSAQCTHMKDYALLFD